jgi:hypothetical protein
LLCCCCCCCCGSENKAQINISCSNICSYAYSCVL